MTIEKFKLKIINGPNLNLLHLRDPHHYGGKSLVDIQQGIQLYLREQHLHAAVTLDWYQSNSESEIIEALHAVAQDPSWSALVINPGAYSHTSLAIADALEMITIPKIEVHLSQPFRREAPRKTLLTAGQCDSIMCGLGPDAYLWGILASINLVKRNQENVSNHGS